MQEAIEYLRKYNLLSAAAILEDKFLLKERKQIIDSFNQDLYGGLSGHIKYEDGEQYYNSLKQ